MYSVPSPTGLFAHARSLYQRLRDRAARPAWIAGYDRTIISLGLDRTTHLMTPQERESLALAFYLDDQLGLIHANNYTAPGLLLGNLLEQALRARIFERVPLIGRYAQPIHWTLGALPAIRKGGRSAPPAVAGAESPIRTEARENWQRLTAYAATHWDDDIVPFSSFAKTLWRTAELRNDAAHRCLPLEDYNTLYVRVCGSLDRPGALALLLTAWRG